MRNTLTIARREFAAYFNSPIAYIVIVVFLLISGYMFFTELLLGGQAEMRPLFGLAPLILTIFIPFVTMRLFAEEKAQGTLEMLLVFPLSDWQVVVGKYLAAMGLVTLMIGLTIPYAVFVKAYGPLDAGPTMGGYLGLLLLASGYTAIGLAASTWTKNQIVAAIVSFVICFALFLAGKLLSVVPPWMSKTLQQISTDYHFQSISRGVLDTRDLIYYATVTVVALLVAQVSLDSRRWR